MNSKVTRITVLLLLVVQVSACTGEVPVTGGDLTKEVTTVPVNSSQGKETIGSVANIRTRVHAGARDDLKLIEGKADLVYDDFVSVTDGGKARLELPGPASLLMFNQTDMDGIKLEYDTNSNARIVTRLIHGGVSGHVKSGNQLTVDVASKVKVNILGTDFFVIYDEETGLITVGKFNGALAVSVPGQPTVSLGDSELVDITSDGTVKHYSPFHFSAADFEKMADTCNSPIQGANILRRDNGVPLPGEAKADKNKELPCGSQSQTLVTPTTLATQTPLAWIDLDYCRRSDKDICVFSLGLLNQDMMITLQVKQQDISGLYILINDNRYPCNSIATSEGKYYCTGEPIRPNTTVTVQVFHRDDQLLAQGDFLIPSLVIVPTPRRRPRLPKYPY